MVEPASEALPIAPGATVGKCKVLELLGKGGMGAVFRARHGTLDIEVALKVISFSAASAEERAEYVARFQREARSAAKVRHENVVSVLDVDEAAGVHFMVMELVDGTSARRLLDQGPLDPREAARIVRDTARALAAAHALGIVHRDVKPENILLTREGRVKVSDFGIAQSRAETDAKLTATGQVVGTPHYMSPEQVEGTPLDGRADIYALGATLYHLVTGTLPFSGTSALQVCMKHVTAPLPPPRERNPAVPPALEAVIVKMMAKRPDDRYPSADAVAAVLEPLAGPVRRPTEGPRGTEPIPVGISGEKTTPYEILAARTPAAHAPPPTAPTPPALPTPARAFRAIGCQVAITLGVVLVAFVGYTQMWQRRGPGSPQPTAEARPGRPTARVDVAGLQALSDLFREASQLMSEGRDDAALAAFDSVVAKGGESEETAGRSLAASALLQSAMLLERMGRAREALERAERLPRDFSDAGPDLAREAKKVATRVRPLAGAEVEEVTVARLLPCPVAATRVVVKDVNGDGRPDILLPGDPGAIFLSQPGHEGAYVRRDSLAPPGSGRAPALLGAGDLDLTGRACVITTGDGRTPGELVLWRIDPKTGAAVPDIVPPDPRHDANARPPRFADCGDFDGNGTPDLVLWDWEDTTVTVRRGVADLPAKGAKPPAGLHGGGQESSPVTPLLGTIVFVDEQALRVGGKLQGLFVADVVGQKRDCIIVDALVHEDEDEIETFFFTADKGFQWTDGHTIFHNKDTWFSLAVGDFDGDGIADIVKTANDASGRSLVAWRATGDTFFEAAEQPLALSFVPWGAALADVDGDGKADLICVERTGKSSILYVFHSNGDGTFRAVSRVKLANMKDVRIVVPADMDRDGKVDLVLYDYAKAIGILYGDGKGHFGNK